MSGCKYMEVSAVAQRLSLSVQSVYRLGEAKELKIVRVGPSAGKRVLRPSVEEFEARRLREFEQGFERGEG